MSGPDDETSPTVPNPAVPAPPVETPSPRPEEPRPEAEEDEPLPMPLPRRPPPPPLMLGELAQLHQVMVSVSWEVYHIRRSIEQWVWMSKVFLCAAGAGAAIVAGWLLTYWLV